MSSIPSQLKALAHALRLAQATLFRLPVAAELAVVATAFREQQGEELSSLHLLCLSGCAVGIGNCCWLLSRLPKCTTGSKLCRPQPPEELVLEAGPALLLPAGLANQVLAVSLTEPPSLAMADEDPISRNFQESTLSKMPGGGRAESGASLAITWRGGSGLGVRRASVKVGGGVVCMSALGVLLFAFGMAVRVVRLAYCGNPRTEDITYHDHTKSSESNPSASPCSYNSVFDSHPQNTSNRRGVRSGGCDARLRLGMGRIPKPQAESDTDTPPSSRPMVMALGYISDKNLETSLSPEARTTARGFG